MDEQDQTPEERLAAARSWAEQADPLSPASPGAGSTQVSERLQTVIDAAERAADAIRQDAEEQAKLHLADAQQKADRLTAERVRLISQLTDDLIEHASVVKEHSELMVGALERAIGTVTGRLEQAKIEIGASSPALAAAELTDTPSSPAPVVEADAGPVAADVEAEPEPEAPVADADGAAETTEAPAPEEESERPEEAEPVAEAGAEAEADAPSEAPSGPEAGSDAPGESSEPAAPSTPAPTAALLRATQLAIAGTDRDSVGATIQAEFGIDPEPVLEQVFADG